MADALASGASVRKDVGVQVPPRAPISFKIRHWLLDLLETVNEMCQTLPIYDVYTINQIEKL